MAWRVAGSIRIPLTPSTHPLIEGHAIMNQPLIEWGPAHLRDEDVAEVNDRPDDN
ncbi:hypothetical protein [Aeromicrobium piscarium]|uniref:hypothetical protein n=1 Tax=Aeromicrobium piscarium TaxID=2590901 RepID=UPI00163D85C4|nr:hypothetical protein [Aeromicrobium piscarium]